MTLIWAEGFTGERALAPAWRRYAAATARIGDAASGYSDRVAAMAEAENAKAVYEALVAEAVAALAVTATAGSPRTHVLIVGVGSYEDAPRIPALTTSVHGARSFADWMLTHFQQPDRPLGSVELLLSPGNMGDWQPLSETAATLGLCIGETLPVERATFAAIKDAFKRWIQRAGGCADNAAFFYFSGHGVWKSVALVLPEDARLPSNNQPPDNLINIPQTLANMFNTQPSVQCFFVDACQEISQALLTNVDPSPGAPLHLPTNSRMIQERDAWIYYGSKAGGDAYGPKDRAPFFTQELQQCLERRGADSGYDGTWKVTTDSLGRALEAAAGSRAEIEKKRDIQFTKRIEVSTFTAELCHIPNSPEVFVRVRCRPPETIGEASLYIDAPDRRHVRYPRCADDWYTAVAQGDCRAWAEFDAVAALVGREASFRAWPPVWPVLLEIQPQVPADGSDT